MLCAKFNPPTCNSLKNDIKLAALAVGAAPKGWLGESQIWLERVKQALAPRGSK